VAYEGDNGYAALVAEVEVDQTNGSVRAKRFVIAHDCGPISNPDGVSNQIEGGVLQGASRALGEEITWDEHKVTSIDWRTYHTLTLGIQVPTIESVLIDRPMAQATGAGEIQNIVDQPTHFACCLTHDRQQPPAFDIELRGVILEQDGGVPVDRPQRRAQIMRNGIGEGLQLRIGSRQIPGTLA